jgi:hypothetical protein
MNELKFIPLQDIIMLTNYRDVEPFKTRCDATDTCKAQW